jgi:DNA-binding MarR family transcriptional regulator
MIISMDSDQISERMKKGGFAAFLLAQVGAHAAKKFAEELAPLKLTPPHAGILRVLSGASGLSQRELAARMGIHPSRLVAIVDEMEALGLVTREANSDDRRQYALQITVRGREVMGELGTAARRHNETLLRALSLEERAALVGLLEKIAGDQGLIPGVHPGYSSLGERKGFEFTR